MRTIQAAHAMKSMSAMIGAVRLSNMLRDLEQMGRRGTVADSQVQMAELEAVYEAVKQGVLDELGKEAA